MTIISIVSRQILIHANAKFKFLFFNTHSLITQNFTIFYHSPKKDSVESDTFKISIKKLVMGRKAIERKKDLLKCSGGHSAILGASLWTKINYYCLKIKQ